MNTFRYAAAGLLAMVMLATCPRALARVNARRTFPSTWATTRVFSDQLTAGGALNAAQIRFAAEHFVGTQKITVGLIHKLRAINPDFIVLHYHLAVWQSGKHVAYIIDGRHWGNDYNLVNQHKNWFLHNAQGHRLMAADGKLLMNIANPRYCRYLQHSLLQQVRAGHDDGVFLDSWSTDAVAYFMSKYPRWCYPAIVHRHKQLGGLTWVQASDIFMRSLTSHLNKQGIYVLPNLGDLVTGWDHTDYAIPNGGMLEDAPGAWSHYGQAQWIWSADHALRLINADKIIMFQSYLGRHGQSDYQKRLYWLGTYLLLRGRYTYITYFADRPFEYYPEFNINLGKPLQTAHRLITELRQGSLFVRHFTRGIVVVNSADHKTFAYTAPSGYRMATVSGGGTIDAAGKATGRVSYVNVRHQLSLPPHSALILVKGRQRGAHPHD